MAPSLRRKPVCFYCGRRSPERQHGRLRQWQCKNCEAVNHLDENGEITDPPVSNTASAVQYAHTVPRAASLVLAPPDETLFCPKCLQNQHLLTELLASYHPPATDTDDSAYEVEYPNYRARLEEQHPQVCEECEPRVRERLRATGYAAKTDHLRRMMERTREIKGRTRLIEVGWRNIVVTAGACGWWASLAGQAIWNIIGATGGVQREDGLRSEETAITLSSCVHQCLRHGTVDTGCAEWTTSIAGPALLLGTMSIWWNNRLKVRVGGSGYRLVGLNEYYKLQVVILVARFCSLAMLQHGTITDPSSTASRAAHIFMLIFLVISATISMRTVKVEQTSRVSWQESPEPLTRMQQQSGKKRISRTSEANADPSGSNRFNPQSPAFIQPFPISNLAPTTQQSYPPPYNPPTPPPEDEADAMDWTPTNKSFRPASTHGLPQQGPIPSAPSPFRGHLPPAPQSQAQRLRNPQNQPSFKKASPEKQQNFFNNMTGRLSPNVQQNQASEMPSSGRIDYPEMAPPKFFPGDNFRTDTGLESLFDSAFTLKDEPPEIRAARERQQQSTRQNKSLTSPGPWERILGCCSLGVAFLAWKYATTWPQSASHLRLVALGVAASVAGRALLQTISRTKAVWSLSDILVFTVELVVSILLGRAVSTHDSMNDEQDVVGTILLGGMIVQELWLYISTTRSPSSNSSATAPAAAATHLQIGSEDIKPDPPLRTEPQPQNRALTPSPLQIQTSRGPTTRSKTKRESFIPSTSLSGLSLGAADSECGSPSSVSSFSTTYYDSLYSQEPTSVTRELRPRQRLGTLGMSRR